MTFVSITPKNSASVGGGLRKTGRGPDIPLYAIISRWFAPYQIRKKGEELEYGMGASVGEY